MNDRDKIERDMEISSFGEILKQLSESIEGLETIVFYDSFGETIDYHTHVEPFLTRLIAAHHGLIFKSAMNRLSWLKKGEIEVIEICANQKMSITIRVGEDSYLTAVLKNNGARDSVLSSLKNAAALLFKEAGY